MTELHKEEARGLFVGDEVKLVGNWVENSPHEGKVYVYQGIVKKGEIDPSGNPFPAPEDMLWFVNKETGMGAPIPLNYECAAIDDMFAPDEDDLSFVPATIH